MSAGRPVRNKLCRGGWALLVLTLSIAGLDNTSVAQPRRPASNVVEVQVRTPHGGFNRLLVSVTLCVPGTSRCMTVDDVMIDTGSTGLRLERSAVPTDFVLPPLRGADGAPIGQCVRFVHDAAWGDLVRADVHLGGLIDANLPIQIIGSGLDHRPASCPPSDVVPTSNGTLGIGPNLTDCTGDCDQSRGRPTVYTCAAGRCAPIEGHVDPSLQLPNPVSLLPVDNNGVVFDLPSPPDGTADSVVGQLTFGVGTEANNGLGRARILKLDRWGHVTTIYDGRTYPESYIDSGTETDVVADDHLPRCSGMDWAFCGEPGRRLDADLVGDGGAEAPVSVRVGDYAAARARHAGADAGATVAAPQGTRAFVWGAPFFLGRRVVLVLDGKVIPGADGAKGPFYGIEPQ